jgi:voltage-gated potassium channel
VDILTVLALVPAMRGLRALRILRLLRTAKFFKYSNPFAFIFRTFEENSLLFAFAFSLLGTAIVLGGVSLFLVEVRANPNINDMGDGIWWSLVTITTVGFGDITPVTSLGRIVGGVLMITGMFTLALFAGVVGHTLIGGLVQFRQEQFRVAGHINHIVVCGYTPGAHLLLQTLVAELGDTNQEVLLFAQGDRPDGVPPRFLWVSGDPTKESELDKVHIGRAQAVVVVGPRNVNPQQADAATLLTIFTLRSYMARGEHELRRKRPLYVVAEVLDSENVEHAKTAGANEVIESVRLGFSILCHALFEKGTGIILSEVASVGHSSLYVGKLPGGLTPPISFCDLVDALKRDHGVLALGVREEATRQDHINPGSDFQVTAGHWVIYMAESAKLPRAIRASIPISSPPSREI